MRLSLRSRSPKHHCPGSDAPTLTALNPTAWRPYGLGWVTAATATLHSAASRAGTGEGGSRPPRHALGGFRPKLVHQQTARCVFYAYSAYTHKIRSCIFHAYVMRYAYVMRMLCVCYAYVMHISCVSHAYFMHISCVSHAHHAYLMRISSVPCVSHAYLISLMRIS